MTTEERIEKLEKAVTGIADQLGNIQKSMTTGFEKIEKNFEALKGDAAKNFSNVGTKLDSLQEEVVTKLDSLQEEISKISDVTGYEEIHANLRRVI